MQSINRRFVSAVCTLVLCVACHPLAADEEEPRSKSIFGWIEDVYLMPNKISFKAKLDTGAKTSSLSALNIEHFERDDDEWVRFEIEEGEKREAIEFEAEVTRTVRIKEHGGGYHKRPVVEMVFCLGHLRKEVEVSLVDRSNFNYPVLLGRNFLRGDILVDAGETYLTKPDCKDAAEH